MINSLLAATIWIIGGNAVTPSSDPCIATTWTADAVLQNATDAPLTVRQVSFSDISSLPIITPSFAILPHTTTSLRRQRGLNHIQTPQTSVWVEQFDVPDGVLVDSRIEIGASLCNVSPPITGPVNGKLSTPTFRSLVPAGTVQRHIGTDLGLVNARVNVGVFNAGEAAAHAHVEVRRACDDALLGSSDAMINRNSLIQVSMNIGAPKPACSGADIDSWVSYTSVTVDQPSLSFVSTISNNVSQPIGPIFAPYALSIN
jgi:hypothetical protein